METSKGIADWNSSAGPETGNGGGNAEQTVQSGSFHSADQMDAGQPHFFHQVNKSANSVN
jgi:hypothetical protein